MSKLVLGNNFTLVHRILLPNDHPLFEDDDKIQIHFVLIQVVYLVFLNQVHSI